MFEPSDRPRIFALPLGCDFLTALLQGLDARLQGQPPQALALVEIFVNTRRTKRRLTDLYQQGPARLLPTIRVIPDLAHDPVLTANIAAPVSPLRRRLEISQLVSAILDRQSDLAPRSAIYDLADSLASLMDEMHGEGVTPNVLRGLDVQDASGHWKRSLKFLNILTSYFDNDNDTAPDKEARQRMVVMHLAQKWRDAPPQNPIIVAGSTGSRGATALFMRAVATLPQGAVVLPGFDFDLPNSVWNSLQDPLTSADHPQAGFHKLLNYCRLSPTDVRRWADTHVFDPGRNRLISLALRPAPVTDQWLTEGPNLPDLAKATQGLSLLEARSSRQESTAIALRLRKAAKDGQKAALITPDRTLTRQVSAALARWNIIADDSAGHPLPQTPPGIFLRLVAGLFGQKLTSEKLLVLLKHPLTNSAEAGRNTHLLRSRDLEIQVLRRGLPYPDFPKMENWARNRKNDPKAPQWVVWLRDILAGLEDIGRLPLSDHLATHRRVAEALAGGPGQTGATGALWQKETGEKAQAVFCELESEADAGGNLSPPEYDALFRAVCNRAQVRRAINTHPLIAIWGTLEARVQGADVIILGGLNDSVWPNAPTPDPWLNRAMRLQAGLLLPERNIGLSAHDFQQAIAGKQVMLTRSIRDADAPTVASRWLIRLTNLLDGLGKNGQSGLQRMKDRGQDWAILATALDLPPHPVLPATRPSPRPPLAARPTRLSVTRIRTLIRDPYAIYAQYVLGLRKLDPINPQPDALIRGQMLHNVMEEFIKSTADGLPADATAQMLGIASRIFATHAPWPAAQRLWIARLAKIADGFMLAEKDRRMLATPALFERKGLAKMTEPPFTLTGTADRIDISDAGVTIYDYKSGALPSLKQVEKFDKQLPLMAAMAEMGAFDGLAASRVLMTQYISLASGAKVQTVPVDNDVIAKTWQGLRDLVRSYRQPQVGYTARSRMQRRDDISDYDHLSRRGEWQDSDPADPQDMS